MSRKYYTQNRVSIIIPTYNYSKYISDTLASVFQQNYHDIEVIVVDDGSTDDTQQVLLPYMNRIIYIRKENEGLSAARNTGIAASTGEFLQFLDADDLLGANTIRYQVAYLKANPEVHVSVVKNKLFRVVIQKKTPRVSGCWALPKTNLDVHLCHFNIAPPHAFMFRRRAIMETGEFDTELTACEDYDYWLRATVAGFIPHYNPNGLVYYRKHSESMSSNLTNQYLHDAILHRRLSAILDRHPSFPSQKRLEGLLAFISGCFLTAGRLESLGIDDGIDLIRLALKYSEEVQNLIAQRVNRINILIMLFCARMINYLRILGVHVSPEAELANEMVKNIINGLNLSPELLPFLHACINFLLFSPREYSVERKEIATLMFRELEARLFGKVIF